MNRDDLQRLAIPFVGRQRWFAGAGADKVRIEDFEILRDDWPKLAWALLEIGGAHYNVIVGGRPMGERAEFLGGHENAVLGEADGGFWYDAIYDPTLALALLAIFTGGKETAEHVRPIGVEQSNSSLVFDDRIIAKVFRRVQPGHNPDVEVTMALSAEGFPHVPQPVAAWQRDGYDLAFVEQFLVDGSEGWALAQTSLRDLYADGPDDPGEAGGDFASEAERLGQVTGEMHVALADAFGMHSGDHVGWYESMMHRLSTLHDLSHEERAGATAVFQRLRDVRDAGPSIRVHGDYHLGQVMRTDTGWYVLDFEGEPARSLDERRSVSSPMKDVTGMLRSFDYAVHSVLAEREAWEHDHLEPLGEAWLKRNRSAFLRGYHDTSGIEVLLPGDSVSAAVVQRAFELEKALYELGYELAYRPGWADIPRTAIRHLTFG
jgi:maltokinase